MTIPSPPPDTSGGYVIIQYTNGTDTHRMRQHVRAFGPDGTYTTPGAGTPGTVQLDFTGLVTKIKPFYTAAWTFSMQSLFTNNGDGTFTEQFGWTAPATIVGTGAGSTPTDQGRALETVFNFRDGHGGRGRCVLLGNLIFSANSVPVVSTGSPTGSIGQQLVDYLTNPASTNIVSHAGHQYQNPARITNSINRRLRRHYGFS